MVRKQYWLVGVLLIGLIAAYQIHSIQSIYMRDDEEIAFRTTSRDLAYTIWYQAEQDVHAPVWFSTFWLWQQFVGGSEFMARVYGIFLSMITLPIVYQIGKTWFSDWRVGLFALVVLGANAYFFIYSLEIRPYAAVMMLSAISMWCFHRWLLRPSRRRALLYGLTLALMMYVHYFLAFLIAMQTIYLFVFYRPNLKMLRQWGEAVVLSVLLWLPWLPLFINQIRKLSSIETSAGNARGLAGIGSTTEPTTIDAILRLLALMTNGQIVLYGVILLVGVVYWRRKREYSLLLLWGIGVPVIALVTNLVFAVYTPRYISYLSLGIALAIGGAFVIIRRYSFVLVGGLSVLSLWFLPSQLPVNRVPHRQIFQNISAEYRPGDAIYFDQASYSDLLVRWQIDHYLPPELAENRVTDVEHAQEVRRVWYVTEKWFDPKVKMHFDSLEPSHPVQTVFGDCNRNWCYLAQLMEAAPWKTPQIFGDDMAFWGEDVVSVTPDAVNTHLWWRLDSIPALDYSMSLQLLDESGTLIAQTDGAVQHYGSQTVQTSQMEPGKIYIDYRSIALPAGTPGGQYRLALVVYDWQTGQRLALPDGSDQLLLDAVTVP